jgi:hypothetical protein
MKRTILVVLVLCIAVFVGASSCLAAQAIYGCVSKNGQLTIVSNPGQCKNNETPISWSIVPSGTIFFTHIYTLGGSVAGEPFVHHSCPPGELLITGGAICCFPGEFNPTCPYRLVASFGDCNDEDPWCPSYWIAYCADSDGNAVAAEQVNLTCAHVQQ